MVGRWDAENDASKVVVRFLGGKPKRVDPGGGASSLHDFDVTLSDGRTFAVEVTRHSMAREAPGGSAAFDQTPTDRVALARQRSNLRDL